MSLRIIKILIVAAIAAWGIFDGIGNIIVYDTWVKIVAFVLALENTMVDGQLSARAVTNPILPHVGYAFIYLSKISAGILCSISAVRLWKSRQASVAIFNQQKQWFYSGCGIILFMLIFGFVVLKGAIFNTGQNPSEFTVMVFQFVNLFLAMIAAALIFVSLNEQELEGQAK